jgi:hypothetical protein
VKKPKLGAPSEKALKRATMKFSSSHFAWGKKFVVAALLFSVINLFAQGQSFTLIFDSGDEIDTITFDPAKISDARLRELMLLSPYIGDYFNQLPPREIWAGWSMDGAVVDKRFFSLNLELCLPDDVAYVHCEANDIRGPNFVHNAEVNLKKSKRGLAWLQKLDAPKQLEPVMKFLVEGLRLSLQTEETRLRYYSTWDESVLKEAHDGIEPAELCSETFHSLEGATSEEEKYAVVAHEWANCMNSATQRKLGKYPVAAWNDFLRAYGIKENFTEIGPPD